MSLLENDAGVIQLIVKPGSDAVIRKIIEYTGFTNKLVEAVMQTESLDAIQQQAYESDKMDNERIE